MAKSFYLFFLGFAVSSLQSMEPSLVNIKNAASWTPLHTAVSVGNEEAVKELLAHDARIDSRVIPSNRTPLMFSAEYNKNAIAGVLLKKGAPVDQTDNDHMTALHIACKKGHLAVLETLVMAGAAVDHNAMRFAFEFKDFSDSSVLTALQGALKKKMNAEQSGDGFSLHRACQADTAEGLEDLVLKGMKIDELDKTGNSALHYAAANTNPEILKTLLAAVKKKANPQPAAATNAGVLPSTSLSGSASK